MAAVVPNWKLKLLQRKREKEVEDEKRRREEEEKAAKVTAWSRTAAKKQQSINNVSPARGSVAAVSKVSKPAIQGGSEAALNRANASQNSAGSERKGSLTRKRTGTLERVDEKPSPVSNPAGSLPQLETNQDAGGSVHKLLGKFDSSAQPGQAKDSRTWGEVATAGKPRPTQLDLVGGVSNELSPNKLNPRKTSPRATAALGMVTQPTLDMDESSSLECTMVDDVTIDNHALTRRFTSESSLLVISGHERVVQSEPTTPQGGSPHVRRRRKSCISLSRQEKKGMGPRRVSFSELRPEVVLFQRDPTPEHSSDDEPDMMRNAKAAPDDEFGPSTALHPIFSPQRRKSSENSPALSLSFHGPGSRTPSSSSSRTESTSSTFGSDGEAFASGPEDDNPPDLYTDISDELAAMMS